MNKILGCVAAIVLLSSISSCRIFRKSSRSKAMIPIGDTLRLAVVDTLKNGNISATDSAGLAKRKDDSMMVEGLLPIWNGSIAYNTFNGKAKVHYEGKEEQQDFAAAIRMEKGKKIWVSITALGLVEVARLQITPDTIVLINRLKKEVTVLPFAEAGKLLPVSVDFITLQALLIGDVLHPSAARPGGVSVAGAGIAIAVADSNYRQSVLFNNADSTLVQQQLIAGSAKTTTLLMQYEEYDRQAGKKFANTRKINVQDSSGSNYIEMTFNKAEFDLPVDFNFSIPAKYTRK